MATVQTALADSIDSSDTRAKLDAVAKKLIKHRIILAEILKECVEEFKDFDIKYIMENCFAGEVKVDVVSVDQDVLDADSTIVGSNTEDTSDKEGAVHYDLVFDAVVPNTNKVIGLVINIEIQVDTDLTYSVITRGVYYLSRLISRQKGTIFTNSHYEKIQKVYSIWICPDPKKKNANSIAEYGFTCKKVIGNVDEPVENYDKMTAVILSMNDDGMEDDNNIIRLLSTLLSTTESVENRKQKLEEDFNIPMTREIEEEVREMCNLGRAVELSGIQKGILQGIQQGRQEGIQEGAEQMRLESILNLMDTLKMNAQQAMDALKVPKIEQAGYAAKIASLH